MSDQTVEELNTCLSAAKVDPLQGWDILVVVSKEGVQKISQKQFLQHLMSGYKDFSADRPDIFDPKLMIRTFYHLTLNEILMNFLPKEHQVQLKLGIGSDGWYEKINANTNAFLGKGGIPSKYGFFMKTDLVNVKGDNAEDVLPDNKIIEIGNENKSDLAIRIDLTNANQLSVFPKPDDLNERELLEGICANLFDNVLPVDDVQQVDLHLVTLKNPSHDGVVLTIKNFKVTAYCQGEDQELRFWITTNQSGNDMGDVHPVFAPNDVERSVLVQGHNANIIFSKQLIENLHLKPTLEQFYDVTFSDLDINGQPFANYRTNIKLVPKNSKPFEKDYSYNHDRDFFGGYHKEGLNCTKLKIDYNKSSFLLGSNKGQISFQWYWDQEFSYSYWNYDNYAYGQHSDTIYTGKIKVTASIDKPMLFQDKDSVKFISSIKVNDDDIKITTKQQDDQGGNVPHFFEEIKSNQKNPEVEEDIKSSVKECIKTFEIDFRSLNYFAEANIEVEVLGGDAPAFKSGGVIYTPNVAYNPGDYPT